MAKNNLQSRVDARAWVTDGKGKMQLTTISVGLPEADEVRVKIQASGLCHTDWDSLRWGKRLIMGHEGAGVIDSIGSNVKGLSIGDAVVLNWAIPCGNCSQCSAGRRHICNVQSPVTGDGSSGHAHALGTTEAGEPVARSFHLGTLSEYTLVHRAAVTKIDDAIPASSASIVGCGVMTGFGSVVNAAKVSAGSSVAVLGCGGIGLNVIQAAAISGATTIIGLDIKSASLERATVFGATHAIKISAEDNALGIAEKELRAIIAGGADFAFECTAIPAMGDAPLRFIRNAGTAVQVSGIEQRINFDCELFEWDKVYINPLYGQCKPDQDFAKIFDLYQQKKLKLDEMISKTYTLEDAEKGFGDMLAGRLAKGVVVMDSIGR